MTDSQTSKAVSRKLASVYGSVWRTHTPSWSKPQCRVHGPRTGVRCTVAASGKGFVISPQQIATVGA